MTDKLEIPKDWQIVSLSKVAHKVTDGSHNPPQGKSFGIPMISAKDVYNNSVSFENPRYISDDDFDIENKRTQIKPGDILLTIVATIGRTAVVPLNTKPFTLQRSVAVIKTDLNPAFLCYYFQSPFFQRQLTNSAKGTAQKGVYLKTLNELKIVLPPKKLHDAIVFKIDELLSELDKGVEEIETAQKQLKVYRQAVLKWAFEGRLTNKHVSEGELPKGWKWVEINDVGKVKGGKRLPPKHLYSEQKTEFVYIMAGNLKDGTVKHSPSYIRKETFDALGNYRVTGNEVYITIVGACIGDAGVIPENIGNAILTENAAKIIELKDIQNVFLAKWLNSHVCQTEIKGKILSATLGKLALNRIGTLKVPLPRLEEQQQIVQEIESRLSVCDKIEETITNSLKQAEAFRQSILKKAFEGKLI